MLAQLRPAVVLTILFTVFFGLVYPFAITGIAQLISYGHANGSTIASSDGTVVGSELIGQAFTSDRYFHGRPSATSDPSDSTKSLPYAANNSVGSNLGPTSKALVDRVKGDVAALGGSADKPVPADAVTTSASGLDPDISPEFALLQIPRVATARGVTEDTVRAIVAAHTDGRLLGIFGEPEVNVLLLNMDLDSKAPAPVPAAPAAPAAASTPAKG